ncbi:hypothetical protein [Paracoccus sp. T5]|uniref:hypothetical protein n=1 Tax=Paracoccus sp. T5 TaxID=3402161 RepID=UPI003AEDAE62
MQFENHGLKGGLWRGRIQGLPVRPARVVLSHHGAVVAEAQLEGDGEGAWLVQVDLPGDVLSDGLQTLLLRSDGGASGDDMQPGGEVLARLPLMAGEPLEDDLAAEIAALRAELELVKRELRRLATDGGSRPG